MNTSYEVETKNPKHKLVVGWNDELETYFLRVTTATETGEQEVAAYGVDPYEMVDVEILDGLAKTYTKARDGLSPKLYKQLFDDAGGNVQDCV